MATQSSSPPDEKVLLEIQAKMTAAMKAAAAKRRGEKTK